MVKVKETVKLAIITFSTCSSLAQALEAPKAITGLVASFDWAACLGEYLRADREHHIESVVWRASSTADGKQAER